MIRVCLVKDFKGNLKDVIYCSIIKTYLRIQATIVPDEELLQKGIESRCTAITANAVQSVVLIPSTGCQSGARAVTA